MGLKQTWLELLESFYFSIHSPGTLFLMAPVAVWCNSSTCAHVFCSILFFFIGILTSLR